MVVADGHSPHAPLGQALVVCAEAALPGLERELQQQGYAATWAANPYDALVELLERPLVYRALVLSLPAVYREELPLIRTARTRIPHIDVFLAHIDGRQGALAEAMRLGATGLLGDEAVHRLAEVDEAPPSPGDSSFAVEADVQPSSGLANEPDGPAGSDEDDMSDIEPILTAEELRALLQEQPTLPPQG